MFWPVTFVELISDEPDNCQKIVTFGHIAAVSCPVS